MAGTIPTIPITPPTRPWPKPTLLKLMQPTLEDLLAQWWRESYPNANLNNSSAALMVAFTSWVLERKAQEAQQ
jgi:hypothetical protein